MGEEITTYDAGYLDFLREGGEEEIAEVRRGVDPLKLMPQIKLDGRDLKATLGDETLFSRKSMYASVILVTERRALWAPENAGDSDNRMPICGTVFHSCGTFNRDFDEGKGRWNTELQKELALPGPWSLEEDEYNDPVDGVVDCSSCMWNKFGSAGQWDSKNEGSRGKACNEGRPIALRFMEKTGTLPTASGDELGIFKAVPDDQLPICLAQLSATSIGTVRAMLTAAAARKIPLSRIIWRLTAKEENQGVQKWSILQAELAGYPDRESVSSLISDRDATIAILRRERSEGDIASAGAGAETPF